MNWIVNKIKRCICCALMFAFIATIIVSNFYTYKTARNWAFEEVCGDIAYYHAGDKDLIKVRLGYGR